MTPTVLRLGTRGSPLALWQSRHVAARLHELHPGLAVELVVLQTEGDQRQDRPIAISDERGVFVRRIEDELLAGRIDLAVHSLKDLPTRQPEGLVIAAVPERHDPHDALLTINGATWDELPVGSFLGTGSFRRRAQLLNARPDLETVPVRGNVDTRVRKLLAGEFDGLVLALAGVERLGIRSVVCRPLDFSVCLPAVGQGALAIEIRADDRVTRGALKALNHAPSAQAVAAERAFLRRLGGGCLAPVGAHATIDGETLRLNAVVGDPDGKKLLRDAIVGGADSGERHGEALAARMIAAGAGEILQRAREDALRGGPAQ